MDLRGESLVKFATCFSLITLSVILASSCRTTNNHNSEAQLLDTATDADAATESASIDPARLYYKHELSALKKVIEYAPDYDSKIILTVDIDAESGPAQIKTYMNNSKGFERTIIFDLATGNLSRTESQLGNKEKLELAAPQINAETEAKYAETLAQLLDQVSAIREGRNKKNAQHLELNNLVSYLQEVMDEVKPIDAATKASRSKDEQTEFTGADAEALMTILESLGFARQTDDMGFPSISLTKIECARNLVGPRIDPKFSTSCSLKKGLTNKSAGPEAEAIYKLLTDNGVREHQLSNKTAIKINSLRCVEYPVTHGTSKCFFVPGIFK